MLIRSRLNLINEAPVKASQKLAFCVYTHLERAGAKFAIGIKINTERG